MGSDWVYGEYHFLLGFTTELSKSKLNKTFVWCPHDEKELATQSISEAGASHDHRKKQQPMYQRMDRAGMFRASKKASVTEAS